MRVDQKEAGTSTQLSQQVLEIMTGGTQRCFIWGRQLHTSGWKGERAPGVYTPELGVASCMCRYCTVPVVLGYLHASESVSTCIFLTEPLQTQFSLLLTRKLRSGWGQRQTFMSVTSSLSGLLVENITEGKSSLKHPGQQLLLKQPLNVISEHSAIFRQLGSNLHLLRTLQTRWQPFF